MDFNTYHSGEHVVVDKAKCLVPSLIDVDWSWNDTQINLLLSKASYYLGVLNTMHRYLPNTGFFITGTILREAIKSNEIEGTKTELESVLGSDSIEDTSNEEVKNYVRAAHHVLDKVNDGEVLTEKMLLETHAIMMGTESSVYKAVQNWIGGSTKYDARFIPAPPEEVDRLMKDLFDFLNNEVSDVPDLVKVAIAHYQFETIHPFDDGNGRLGRLLVPMYLIQKKVLNYPLFVSTFLAEQRKNYYENLDMVRTANDMNHWVKFFLVAIKESAKSTIAIVEKVHDLMKRYHDIVDEMYGAKGGNAIELLKYIFYNPIVSAKEVVDDIDVSSATANSLLQNFEKADILEEVTGNKRNRVYAFKAYLDLITDKRNE